LPDGDALTIEQIDEKKRFSSHSGVASTPSGMSYPEGRSRTAEEVGKASESEPKPTPGELFDGNISK
jgi:hypothetical protein